MKIIGHRGARGEAPENTEASIAVALRERVDMIEVDLRLLDGAVVLSHDPVIPGRQYATLNDILVQISGKIPLNLEIKEFEVVNHLSEFLSDYSGEILLSSFDYKTLKHCREIIPKHPIAVLESWSGVRATSRAKRLDTKRIHMNQRWLWRGFISSMASRGWELYAYTTNTEKQAEIFAKAGLAGIFTDYPARLIQYNYKRK